MSEAATRGWSAYLEALGGEPQRAQVTARALRQEGTAESLAWSAAVEVALWQALPSRELPMTPEQVARLGLESGRAAAALICLEGARTAFLQGRGDQAAGWSSLAVTLDDTRTALVSAARSLAGAFQAAAEGRWEEVQASAAEGSRLSRAGRLAPFVVEATALGALAQLGQADLEGGLEAARRAVRMARTEELIQPSYLAGLVLARARRLVGHFHLASRILESLARVAPTTWTSWLSWERALAGSSPRPVPTPAAALLDWISALEAGDQLSSAELQTRLAAAASTRALAAQDVWALAAALGLSPSCPPALRGFRHDISPRQASGFEGLPRPLGPQIVAVVEVRPGAPAARRLALGASLAPPLLSTARPGRPEATLAALALAGPDGSDVASLFRHIYRFEYVKERHANVFDVMLHRARTLLGRRGELAREGDSLRFSVTVPFSVPDSSLQRSPTEGVLHSLSVRARGSAREIAEDLGMPLRTVQAMLRELVDQGACFVERSARQVEYVVEDTTFREPTAPGWRRE